MNYIVKCQALTPTDELPENEAPKMATFHVIVKGVSYTDAEAKGYEFYEKNLKERKFEKFRVDSIKTDNFQHSLDGLGLTTLTEEELQDSGLSPIVYRVKVDTHFRTEPNKWKKVVVLVRAYSIEDATTKAVDYIADEWRADITKCSNASETVLCPMSPIFDVKEEN